MKKQNHLESPNLSKLQPVQIDAKTIIYIPLGANASEAKVRFLNRINSKVGIHA